jgi:hypothetical protein
MEKVTFQIDKSISVPAGSKVLTEYVHIDKIRLGCKSPMSIGDVKEKYELVKQNAPASLFPAPMGEWKEDRFVIIDGRHTYVAYLMMGYEYVLVSWLA